MNHLKWNLQSNVLKKSLQTKFRTKDWDAYFEKISVKAQNFVARRRNDCRKMKKYILFALNHIWCKTKRQMLIVV